jgi:hypothetical protein
VRYKSLKSTIEVVPSSASEFELISKYIRNTHGKTHTAVRALHGQPMRCWMDDSQLHIALPCVHIGAHPVKAFVHNRGLAFPLQYTLHVEDVFAVQRAGETERYIQKYKDLENKQLLWHGVLRIYTIELMGPGAPRACL